MSDGELNFSEEISGEGYNLKPKQEKQKRAALSDQDNAALLSDESSEDHAEDLVLEYTDVFAPSGKILDSVEFEEGRCESASDKEITAFTEDGKLYEDELDGQRETQLNHNIEPPAQRTEILVQIDDEEPDHEDSTLISLQRESGEETGVIQEQGKNASPGNTSLSNSEISKIVEVLSSQALTDSKNERSQSSDSATVHTKNSHKSYTKRKLKKKSDIDIFHNDSSSFSSDLEDNVERIYGPKNGVEEGMNNGDLEWDDQYLLEQQRGTGNRYHGNANNKQGQMSSPVRRKPKKHNSRHSRGSQEKLGSESPSQQLETELTETVSTYGESSHTVANDFVPKRESQDEKESVSSSSYSTEPRTPVEGSNNRRTPGSSKKSRSRSSRQSRRTRHRIYLDDPDVHQFIADHASMLRRYINDAQSGSMPTGSKKDRLRPISQDELSSIDGKMPKSRRKKQSPDSHKASLPNVSFAGGKDTATSGSLRQAKSLSSVGPYDGHGKRGRNLITRIQRGSETSSTDEDEDDFTNRTVGDESIDGSSSRHRTDKEWDELFEICPECGERHPPDDEFPLDQEICPDCGVPHNPYQHQPSGASQLKWQQYMDYCRNALFRPGSGKDYQQINQFKWQQYVENCSKAMFHQKNCKEYQQIPQDPPETQETLPSIEGPHTKDELSNGVKYYMKYLGSTQVTTQHPVTKETRMQQAQEAYSRIKVPDEDTQPSTDVEAVISTERIKVFDREQKFADVMMDHALRTVCFICDMGNILVLMARRLTADHMANLEALNKGLNLKNLMADKEKRTSKNMCHVFECEEASKVAKAIGQAFNMAYRHFLKTNGISHENVEETEYCHVLESQRIVGQDLDLLTNTSNARDVVVQKKRGDAVGVMLLESGWGSMLPTVFIAHIANYSAAARLGGQLSVGDHMLACNGASLVGLPLSECTQVLRNTRSSTRVILRVVSCPPVVDVVVSRPDVKYQLGFSVQNGTICSLLRGGIAERGGVRVGHRIIEINGDSVVAKSHQHIVDVLANTVGEISMKTMPVAMYRLMVGIDQPQHV